MAILPTYAAHVISIFRTSRGSKNPSCLKAAVATVNASYQKEARSTMNSLEDVCSNLDTEFDQYLVEMKPHVIKLPHKSDRQRCALWIKKFCEPPNGLSGRKTRNQYSELLLHMLMKSKLDGPFTQKPATGSLPALPSYMSMYIDGTQTSEEMKENRLPDWVAGELNSELSGFSRLSADPVLAPANRSFEEVRERFNDAVGRSPRSEQRRADTLFNLGTRDRTPSPPLYKRDERVPPLHLDDFDTKYTKTRSLFADDTESPSNGELDFDFTKPKSRVTPGFEARDLNEDWRNPTFGSSVLRDSTFQNDSMKVADRELDMRSRMLEARFQEEKLRLQQKHDSNVQKILERKNTELEDLKTHYRNKTKEQEETFHKLEKKVQQYQKELSHVKESRDRQVEELKRHTEDQSQTKTTELNKKLHDTVAQFEQEKFDLQKQHTRNIQELLEDTNTRLQKMEDEYTQQMDSTSAVINELESRVHQLSQDAENLTKIRTELERDKAQLSERCDRAQAELMDYRARNTAAEKELSQIREEHEKDIRSLRNKHEASVEFLKQEQQITTTKTTDTISELESHLSQLKQALEKADQDHQKKLRESEEQHYQDKVHSEHMYEKKLKALQQEIEQLEDSSQKKIRKFEDTVREKEDEVTMLKLLQEQKASQSDRALQTFKLEVERNSQKMFEDMKKQMEKVESDLNHSKQLREKQTLEFQKQLQEEKYHHEQQITELRVSHEQEKAGMLQQFQLEKDASQSEKETEMERLRESMKQEVAEVDVRARDRQDRDSKTISELDSTVQKLREEVVNANQLRKQQLVELGLLREEEKQRMLREHEHEISQLHYDLDQQKLELEKKHGGEMEAMLEKTNNRLHDIETEYTSRLQKSNEMTVDLQGHIEHLKGEVERVQQQSSTEISQNSLKFEEERRKWKQQNANNHMSHQQEVEVTKDKLRKTERRLVETEQDYEEKLTQLRSQYEQKMKGMVSSNVRQELEETISSLKSQVASLQSRCVLLQDELDYPTTTGNKLYTQPQNFNLSNTLASTLSSKSMESALKDQ